MIEITVQDMINNFDILKNLLDSPLPSKTAFLIARVIKGVETEYAIFQNARGKLLNKYGEHDENGNLKNDENGNIKISQENIESFNKEVEDLLTTRINLNADPFELDDLNITLTPRQVLMLEPFIQK